MRHVLALSATTVAAAVLPVLPSAAASSLSCGDIVTADITLTRNLTCSGTALRVLVTAPDTVHVNLNGHRLTGDGTGVGIEVVSPTSQGSLSVSRGTIRGFGTALIGGGRLPVVDNVSIDRVELRSNGQWVPRGAVRAALTLTGSRVIDSGLGGASTDSGALTVRRSYFLRLSVASSSESYNYLYDSVFVEGGFSHGFAGNVIAVGNTFRRCSIGISAPDVFPSSPTRIDRNVFDSCTLGLQLAAIGGTVSVSGNTFLHNTGEGFTFAAPRFTVMEVEGNRLLGNGGSGMSGTGNPGVRITNNVARGNGGHGIDVTGATDGGGNVATGNATAPQCVGVACTS